MIIKGFLFFLLFFLIFNAREAPILYSRKRERVKFTGFRLHIKFHLTFEIKQTTGRLKWLVKKFVSESNGVFIGMNYNLCDHIQLVKTAEYDVKNLAEELT